MKKTKKINNKFKKIGLWVVVLTVLVSTIFGSTQYALAEEITVRNAKNLIEDAATAQVVAQKFVKCIPSIMNSNYNIYSGDEVFSGKVYWGSHFGQMNPTNIATGAWLEDQVQGNGGDDGEIYCSQGIWEVFSSTFGVDSMAIACNKDSDSGNGHLTGGLFRHVPDDVDCQDGSAGSYILNENAEDHIKNIYEKAMAGNPYAKPWGSITSYDSSTGYELYRRDLLTACVSSFEEDASNAGKYSVKAKVVNNKGEIEEFYALTKNGKKGSSNAGNTAASRGKLTCDDLMGYMNTYAEDYRNAILDAIKQECASADVIAKVDEYIAKYESKEDLTEEETAELEKMKAAKSSGDYTQATDKGGLECAEFKDITITTEPDTPVDGADNGGDAKEQSHDEREEKCYAEAKSLGWIICPMIFGLEEVTSNIYAGIEPLIRVDNSIVSQMNNGSGIYSAWNTFRMFANIIFVILFMFVIFSQLTGFGIDNYGIKKMLPKIIITAILVNFSFYICAIAIDISNIVGSGIRSLFESIPVTTKMPGTNSVDGFQKIVAVVVDFVLIAGVSTGAAVGAFMLNGWAVIIPILLFLLVAIVTVIFAFIILGVRQAAVILCIVFAPLAFACNMLPNTEKAFKRWLDIFKGVLLVYPIIGGLIGAGYFASKILLTQEHDLLMTIIAGLLCVIPYFMVPSLLKKSLNAVGDIGNKIAGIRRKGTSAGTRFANNLDAVKNAKTDSAQLAAQRRAQRFMNSKRGERIGQALKDGKKVSLRDANRYQRAAARANSTNTASIAARQSQSQYNRMRGTGFDAAMAAAGAAEFDTEVGNYEKLIATGDYKPSGTTDPNARIDSNDNDALQHELEHELSQTGNNVNGAKIRALQNQLAKNGKEGRNAMFNAMAAAQSKAGANGLDTEAVKSFSSNILNNHAGTVKDKHRSLYEFAKNTAVSGKASDGKSSNIKDYITGGIQSMTSGDLTGADTQQLARYIDQKSIKRDANGNVTGASWSEAMSGDGNAKNRAQLAKLANEALSDDHLAQSLSGKQRDALESLVYANGGTPPVRKNKMEGDSGKIHEVASSAQQITATQAAARVQEGVAQRQSAASTDRNVQNAEAAALNIINSGAADRAPTNQIIGADGQPIRREQPSPKNDNGNQKS